MTRTHDEQTNQPGYYAEQDLERDFHKERVTRMLLDSWAMMAAGW